MSACIFVGPTLRHQDVAAALEGAVCLPPAAQGDVYRATRCLRPRAIGIIDGYFCGAPSVWHKEILWALSQGIHVFGSASMGALRAAELHTFGMRGVGRIFESFRDGDLEDDDEVAVVHGPAEMDFLAASEPMVSIRSTLERAQTAGVVGPATRRALEALGKSLFFPHRCWSTILDSAPSHGVSASEAAALRDWLPHGQVDQKRDDALAMLNAMQETLSRAEPFLPTFRFERTYFWNELVDRTATEDGASIGKDENAVTPRAVVHELRLQGPEVYGKVKAAALVRWLAQKGVLQEHYTVEREAVRQRLVRLRAEQGLYDQAALHAWLKGNHLDEISLERLLSREVRAEAVLSHSRASLDGALIDELRLNGAYAALAGRARRKNGALAECGVDVLHGNTTGANAAALRLWFFSQRLGRPMPEDVVGFAHDLGFGSLIEFDSALRFEEIYSSLHLDLVARI